MVNLDAIAYNAYRWLKRNLTVVTFKELVGMYFYDAAPLARKRNSTRLKHSVGRQRSTSGVGTQDKAILYNATNFHNSNTSAPGYGKVHRLLNK
jgi:hypothetical protein